MKDIKWKVINFWETTKHKAVVFWFMMKVVRALIKRALVHDMSKYSKKERPYFEEALPKLRSLTYGSDEYFETLDNLKPALDHHYQRNSHHPEYWASSYEDMPLLDKVEMLCDWAAAAKRHNDGDIRRSIEVNKDRFSYGQKGAHSLQQTAIEIGLIKKR